MALNYFLDEKDQANPRLQETYTDITDTNSLSWICSLDQGKIKQLQKQDDHITKWLINASLQKWYDTLLSGQAWHCL